MQWKLQGCVDYFLRNDFPRVRIYVSALGAMLFVVGNTMSRFVCDYSQYFENCYFRKRQQDKEPNVDFIKFPMKNSYNHLNQSTDCIICINRRLQ